MDEWNSVPLKVYSFFFADSQSLFTNKCMVKVMNLSCESINNETFNFACLNFSARGHMVKGSDKAARDVAEYSRISLMA